MVESVSYHHVNGKSYVGLFSFTFRAYTCAIIDCWYMTCMGAVEGFVCHVLLFAIMSLSCTLLLPKFLCCYAQSRAL